MCTAGNTRGRPRDTALPPSSSPCPFAYLSATRCRDRHRLTSLHTRTRNLTRGSRRRASGERKTQELPMEIRDRTPETFQAEKSPRFCVLCKLCGQRKSELLALSGNCVLHLRWGKTPQRISFLTCSSPLFPVNCITQNQPFSPSFLTNAAL